MCSDRRRRRHGWGCGARCKYVLVSSVGASMRLRAPQPHPCRRSTVGWCPLGKGKGQGKARGKGKGKGKVGRASAFHWQSGWGWGEGRGSGCGEGREVPSKARHYSSHPCGRRRLLWFLTLLSMRHRGCVGGRWGWVGRALSRMDAATELTWTYLQRALPTRPHRPSPQTKRRCS